MKKRESTQDRIQKRRIVTARFGTVTVHTTIFVGVLLYFLKGIHTVTNAYLPEL